MQIKRLNQLYILLFLFSLSFFSNGCKEYEPEIRYVYDQTKSYFFFQEGSTWTYESEDSTETEVYELKGLEDFIYPQENSQYIFYDLVKSPEHKITVRIDSGPLDYADRVSYLVYKHDTMNIGSLIYSQKVGFYIDASTKLDVTDTLTLRDKTYTEVLIHNPTHYDIYSEVVFAKDFGMVSYTKKGGKKFVLVQQNLKR